MIKQTQLPTEKIRPNENISFPVGTILTVKQYFDKLRLQGIFSKFKKRGREISSLIQSLTAYKLTENLSISKASDWINREEVLNEFNLKRFHEKTLFRLLGILGKNREEIISDIQDNLFDIYTFEHTDCNIDWTSLILWGEMCKIGKNGYSKDYRPDKKQINLGIAEIANPVNVPIGVTVSEGNVHDMTHFEDSFNQIKDKIRPNSRITFDKGAKSNKNIESVIKARMKYLTAKKLNKSDDKRIHEFTRESYHCIDKEKGIYAKKFKKPSKIDYFFYSEELHRVQLESKKKKAKKMLEEAKEIQKSIDNKRSLPKRFQIRNKLVEVKYDYQTKLVKLDEEKALEFLEKELLSGREGFFCLCSSDNLTLEEALKTYRKKDSVEKIIHSLKNEIEIKPLRVWTEESIYGAIIIGFLAQLIISLMRYDHQEIKHISTKFIKNSLMNLTVTIEFLGDGKKRRIYANFNPIIKKLLAKWAEIT